MNERLIHLIQQLPRLRVLVVGDMMLDKYVWGDVSRISPEAPIQVLNVQREEYRLGGAANVAYNLVALGADVSCIGSIGTDPAGKVFLSLMKQKGVNAQRVLTDASKPTCTKTRMIAHNQHVLRVDHEKTAPISYQLEHQILQHCRQLMREVDLVVISDYYKGTITPLLCHHLIEHAKTLRKPVLAGPKGGAIEKYKGVAGITLNRAELRQFSHLDDVEKGAEKVIQLLALKFLVVTLGEKGIALFRRNEPPFTLPTVARQVYDVTGAGDTVLAAFGLFYTAGSTLEDAVNLANRAAAIVVGKVGTEVATRAELVEQLSQELSTAHEKRLNERTLSQVVERLHAQGKKIVFTNGCFDVLHAGHIATLRFAKSSGDVLIIGVNSDGSVRRLKGAGRPITKLDERLKVLEALEAVDYLAVFEDDTPLKLIRKIKPDVLIKGADWKENKVVGKEVVERAGGKVLFAPLVDGLSTSHIVKRILEKQKGLPKR